MQKVKGKVLEIFIPEEYKDGHLLDIMERSNIGFKILTADGVVEYITEINDTNANILKDDIVIVTTRVIDNHEFIDIDLWDGDSNE